VRHGLIDPVPRRRKREDYRRWERGRPMELWQMDIVGGVLLAGGGEAKVVTGVDDHSRFCVIAAVVPKATGRAVCLALVEALRDYGIPDEVLTDTASNSPPGSAEVGRPCSTGSAGRTASRTGSPNPGPRRPPGRSKGSI
jgi:transposase InsO family protein